MFLNRETNSYKAKLYVRMKKNIPKKIVEGLCG